MRILWFLPIVLFFSCGRSKDSKGSERILIRSSYDAKNDVLFIYTREDSNGNGLPEKVEPLATFMIELSAPEEAKRIF